MHYFIEPKLLRTWFLKWNLELSWAGSFCFGLGWGSHDVYSPETVHVYIGLGWLQTYIVWPAPKWMYPIAEKANLESQFQGWEVGFQVRSGDLHVHYGLSDGRPKSSPWLFEWPWRRWKYRKDLAWEGSESVHPYTYVLRSGFVQNRSVTIKPVYSEWRWLFWWTPIRRTWRGINFSFDGEVGERTGSWKGGVLGSSEKSFTDESSIETLRRMERNRKFD